MCCGVRPRAPAPDSRCLGLTHGCPTGSTQNNICPPQRGALRTSWRVSFPVPAPRSTTREDSSIPELRIQAGKARRGPDRKAVAPRRDRPPPRRLEPSGRRSAPKKPTGANFRWTGQASIWVERPAPALTGRHNRAVLCGSLGRRAPTALEDWGPFEPASSRDTMLRTRRLGVATVTTAGSRPSARDRIPIVGPTDRCQGVTPPGLRLKMEAPAHPQLVHMLLQCRWTT